MNKIKVLVVVLVAIGAVFFFSKASRSGKSVSLSREVTPFQGSIQQSVLATAVVQPQNRLEMKPPVAGRVDKIFVSEGQVVKEGETVALMSSTERAALLDAARAKGDKEMGHWEDIYRPIPLIAPIDGTVIVSTMQPGQTVTQTDAVLVLSDRLIVQAQVDETDIGKVHEGESATVSLDAYPDIEVKAKVEHIYHESKTVNNVTIYQVDILPIEVPAEFRSGMSANVRIISEEKNDVLLLPLEAVKREKDRTVVLVKEGAGKKPSKRTVVTGLSDEENIEVISGLGAQDTVIVESQKYEPAKTEKTSNSPFMPGPPRRSRDSRPA